MYVQNSTIANNNAGSYSGIYFDMADPYSLRVMNTVIHNDSVRNSGIQTYTNCVLDPAITHATGANIIFTNAPGFADADAENYRLASGSVCINAGTNQSWMTGALDLDGVARIDSGIVDIGAYEHATYGTIVIVQ